MILPSKIGFTLQAASPACTELEIIILDWLGKLLISVMVWNVKRNIRLIMFLIYFFTGRMIGLPREFLCYSENSKGGGVIQVYPNRLSVLPWPSN